MTNRGEPALSTSVTSLPGSFPSNRALETMHSPGYSVD